MVASVTTMAGRPSPATSTPFMAPRPAPSAKVAATTSGIGRPARASRPAATPQMENCEPMEMSMCRARMTSVMPTPATSTGALLTSSSRRFLAEKNAGAFTAKSPSRAANARATDSSRW